MKYKSIKIQKILWEYLLLMKILWKYWEDIMRNHTSQHRGIISFLCRCNVLIIEGRREWKTTAARPQGTCFKLLLQWPFTGTWVASAGSQWSRCHHCLPPPCPQGPSIAVFFPASLPLVVKLCLFWSAVLTSLKLLPLCISLLGLGCSFQAVFSAFPSLLVSYASDISFSSVLVSCL